MEEKEIKDQETKEQITDKQDAANEAEANQDVDAQVDTDAEVTPEEEQPVEPTLEEQLAEAQQQIADLKKEALYKQAEFDNYRKNMMKQKAELILNGGKDTILKILPVLDDFERAIQTNEKSEDIEAVKEGFNLIYKKFQKILEGMGVKTINTKDADFDVDYHEAIAKLPMGEEKKGKVVDCVQKGYTLNDKVIRYAKVAVGE